MLTPRSVNSIGPLSHGIPLTLHPVQSLSFVETPRSPALSPSSRLTRTRQPPSRGTSPATTPTRSVVCTSTSSVTTPTAAPLLALTVCDRSTGQHNEVADQGPCSQPPVQDPRCSYR